MKRLLIVATCLGLALSATGCGPLQQALRDASPAPRPTATPIAGSSDLDQYLELHTRVGQAVQLTILRDGQERTLSLTLAERT